MSHFAVRPSRASHQAECRRQLLRKQRRAMLFESLENRSLMATLTWDGGGAIDNFNDPLNWDNAGADQLPAANDTLVFSGLAPGAITNDLAAGTTFALQFTAGGYTLTGNSINLNQTASATAFGIQNTAGDNTVGTPLTLGDGATNTLDVQGGNLTVSGVISNGAGNALTKTGGGTFIPTGVNTYTGSTTLSAGVLSAGATTALGNGSATNTLVLDGGTLRAAAAFTSPAARGVVLNGATTSTIDTNNVTLTIQGVISGGTNGVNGLTVVSAAGTSNLVLSGNNTFLGNLIVNRGTVSAQNSNALGASGAGNATIVNGNDGTTNNTRLLLNAGAATTIAESLVLAASGSGRVTLEANSGVVHTLTGPIDISSAVNLVQFSSNGAGALTVTGDIVGNMTGGSQLLVRGGSTNALNHLQGSVNLTGGNFTKTDAGLWVIGAAGKTYSWVNTQVSLGTLRTNAANMLPATGTITMGQNDNNSGSLLLNGFSQSTAGITYNYGGSAVSSVGTIATGAGSLTLTGNLTYNTANTYTGTGGVISGNLDLGGGTRTFTINDSTGTANEFNISAVISNGAVTKAGAGALNLSAANTYAGTTTLGAGTLRMVGGNDRILPTSVLAVTGTSTLDLGANSQTLSQLTVADATTLTFTVTGATGTLTVSGAADLQFGPGGALTTNPVVTVNMAGLGNFNYTAPANTFRVGLKTGATNTAALGNVATVTLAQNNNITAAALQIANVGASSDGGAATLNLGQTNVINVNSINMGFSGRSDAALAFATGLVNPSVTFRGTAGGTSSVANWSMGNVATFSTAPQLTFNSTANFSLGTIDANITDLIIASANTGGSASRAGIQNATFTQGAGTVNVGTVTIGVIAGSNSIAGPFAANGIYNLNSPTGVLNASTITLAENTITAGGAFTKTVTGALNLIDGTVKAGGIQRGSQTGVVTTVSATMNWTNGIVQNQDLSNLTITNVPITLLAGSHVFNATGLSDITQGNTSPISGPSGIEKVGTGRLILSAANTYSGNTVVTAGTLVVQGGDAVADAAGPVTVADGATLRLNQNETISGFTGSPTSTLALQSNALTVTTGNVLIGSVTTNFSARLTALAGGIVDNNGASTNIVGLGITLEATAGIGSGDALETQLTVLEADNNDGLAAANGTSIEISNFGFLTITDVTSGAGLGGADNAEGATTIVALSPLTVASSSISAGPIVLTAADNPGAGDNLTVNSAVTVQSTGGSVTLNAGDNLTVSGNVTSDVSTVTMNVDAGNVDAGTGGLLNITGVITTPVVGSGGGAFINGQTDNDTFTFNPQTTTEFRLLGNAPLGTLTGDTLVMDVTGTANPNLTVPGTIAPYNGLGSGVWSFTSAHRPVLFGSIEQSNILGNYHLTYDNSVTPISNLIVMRDAGQTNFQLRNGSTAGPIVYQGSLATILSLRILGSAGNDTVTVDDINTLPDFVGTVPLVTDNANLAGTAELLFDGLGGTDTLVYNINGATASQQYAIGNGSGSAGLEGEIESVAAGVNLNTYFQNVELTQRTGAGATPAGLTIIGDSSGNAFTAQADGALTRTSITGYTPFEFSGNNYNAVTINALAGSDNVDLVSLGSGQTNNPAINLNGGAEDDTIRVRSTSLNTGLVTLAGDAGNDLFQLFDAGNTVDSIVGPVLVDGTDGNVGGNTDTLTIIDSGDTSLDNVLISAVNPGASQDYAVEGITTTVGNDVALRNIDVLNYTGTSGNDNIDARFVSTVPLHDLNTVTLSGWTGADQFLLFTSDQIGGSGAGVTPTGVASGVANINLFGDALGNPNTDDGNDSFGATPVGLTGTGVSNVGLVVPDSTRMIRPSASTSIAIDGGQPTGLAAPLGDVTGDVMNVDISALPNSTPVVVSTFAPGTVVAAGIQPLTWTQIEDINVVDQGKLTNVQMGDLFARTTPGADLIQITRNPTLLNPNQVRLRLTASIANYSASNKTIIYGGDANDTITQSNLTIPAEFYGEAGDDYLTGATNNDWLVGGLGNDRINGGAGDNVIWGDNAPTLPSDPNPQDLAIGGDDQLSGLGGNDVFYGGGGNDLVSAGAGNDYANGGQGNDTLDGNDGDDRLYGGLGNDRLDGSAGNDLLSAGAGDDELFGGTGNDVLFAGAGADRLVGGDGNDLVVSGSVANENSIRTSLANTATYSSATYTNGADNDAALLNLLSQWGSASNRSSIGAITHDGVADELSGGTGDDDFCWETADIISNFPSLTPADYNAFGMGTDERFGPT